MDTFSERLKHLMKIKDVKQADVVRGTKINKGALSSYLSGRYMPKQKTIKELADYFDVPPAYLLGFDDEAPHIIYDGDEKFVINDEYEFVKSTTNLRASHLRILREINKLSYETLSEVTGASIEAIKEWATGKDSLTADELNRLTDFIYTSTLIKNRNYNITDEIFKLGRAYDKAPLKTKNIIRMMLDLEPIETDNNDDMPNDDNTETPNKDT